MPLTLFCSVCWIGLDWIVQPNQVDAKVQESTRKIAASRRKNSLAQMLQEHMNMRKQIDTIITKNASASAKTGPALGAIGEESSFSCESFCCCC